MENISDAFRGSIDTCLVGTLETWSLSEMILWLNKTKRTAMVRVGIGLDAGVIFFRGGILYRCEWKGFEGCQALFALLNLSKGTFCLIQRDMPTPRPNVFISTEQILLNWAISRDEQNKSINQQKYNLS